MTYPIKIAQRDIILFGFLAGVVLTLLIIAFRTIAVPELMICEAALLILVFAYTRFPRALELTKEHVRIKLIFGNIFINYTDIASVAPYEMTGKTIRLFGTSGLQTCVGYFRNSEIGTFKAYVAERKECILLTLKSGKKIVFSVPGRDEVIDAIKSHL